ncbi:hypothetical protein A2U01_0099584, partial [Trifolium medium]|nr:hypothetical protein [Trifolium medium]
GEYMVNRHGSGGFGGGSGFDDGDENKGKTLSCGFGVDTVVKVTSGECRSGGSGGGGCNTLTLARILLT